MSLDIVELVMEFENAFAIQIPDAEAEEMSTISLATDVILRHIELQPASACKTQKLFHQLRRYFVENLGTAKDSFHPTTCLWNVMPYYNRQGIWKRMEKSLGWRLPALTAKDLNLSPYVQPRKQFNFSGHTFWGSPLETPVLGQPVRDVIGYVFAINYEKLVALPALSSRFEVEKVVMGITQDKSGVAIQDIRPESSFTNDLGMD